MILLKQAMRGLWRGKRNFAACIMLVALGVASYVGFIQAGHKLLATMNSMYKSQDFAEAFAHVGGIPEDGVYALRSLDGIEQVSATATVYARVLSEGDNILNLNVISHDENNPAPLDRVLLLDGKMPARGQIAVGRIFFEAQGLEFGQTLELSYGGRLIKAEVCGVVASPAYILESGDPSEGYAYMESEAIQTLSGSPKVYNALSFTLSPGGTFGDIEAPLSAALERYGLESLYSRHDHPNHYAAWMSFENFTMNANTISLLFFSVAVMVLYILMRRLIEQERTQIGTMKAFGIGNGSIIALYVGYGAIIGLSGWIIGTAFGIVIIEVFVAMYHTFLTMPPISWPLDLSVLATAFILAVLTGVIGAITGTRSALKLQPAEAMRPPAPPPIRHRARSRPSRLPFTLSMALRGISRAKFRSGFIAGGLAISFSILTFMSSYKGITEDISLTEFTKVQLYDLRITLVAPQPHVPAVQSAQGLDGVTTAEGMLQLPVAFRKGHLEHESLAIGLERDGKLRRLYDSEKEAYMQVPQSGAIITNVLAEKLEAAPGDVILMTADITGDEEYPVTVSGLIGTNEGYAAYLTLDNLCGILGAQNTVNSLMLTTSDTAAVKAGLDDARNVSAISDIAVIQQIIQAELDASLGANLVIFAIMGLGVAIAVIVSTASISLSERTREYATMRVLGSSPAEIGRTLMLEYLLLSAIAVIPGIPLSIGFLWMVKNVIITETFSISMKIAPVHYIVSGVICLITSVLANLSSIRSIARMEMAHVLKERE